MILLHMSARTRSSSFRLPQTWAPSSRGKGSLLAAGLCRPGAAHHWKIRDTYEKNGRQYQVMAITIAGPEIVIEREMHSVFYTVDPARGAAATGPHEGQVGELRSRRGLAREDRPADAQPGAGILRGGLDEPGWPHRNIHTDRATAQAAGLPDIIVSGTQFEGILITHLIGLFGVGWYQGGELEAKIVKSAFVNDEVTRSRWCAASGARASTPPSISTSGASGRPGKN